MKYLSCLVVFYRATSLSEKRERNFSIEQNLKN
nr:MAG TPA: hypothetical protein [Bacteriophage sp.]